MPTISTATQLSRLFMLTLSASITFLDPSHVLAQKVNTSELASNLDKSLFLLDGRLDALRSRLGADVISYISMSPPFMTDSTDKKLYIDMGLAKELPVTSKELLKLKLQLLVSDATKVNVGNIDVSIIPPNCSRQAQYMTCDLAATDEVSVEHMFLDADAINGTVVHQKPRANNTLLPLKIFNYNGMYYLHARIYRRGFKAHSL